VIFGFIRRQNQKEKQSGNESEKESAAAERARTDVS